MAKKEKNCDPDDPADDRKGDAWDHVAIDAESRLVVSVVPGERTAESVVAVVEDFKRRTGGRLMDLITTDGYPDYDDEGCSLTRRSTIGPRSVIPDTDQAPSPHAFPHSGSQLARRPTLRFGDRCAGSAWPEGGPDRNPGNWLR